MCFCIKITFPLYLKNNNKKKKGKEASTGTGTKSISLNWLSNGLLKGQIKGAKWPISINFRNIWPKNTVCEISREIPLFLVLELGELEYPIFLIHRGT